MVPPRHGAPAVAVGRAARMSLDCSGYDVYAAAREILFCDVHGKDEMVLLVRFTDEGEVARHDEQLQLDMMLQFVQSAKEHPWSSHWREPTGFYSDYNRERPTISRRTSLPR
ncbi:hypothetical protein [Amycolatopsis sp. NPDC004079]|uniref:hypothetical protein n=1 Tax=Amycolatopsis sp. NPDC004079 TaxID=3154549 RepID=UPI0033B16107